MAPKPIGQLVGEVRPRCRREVLEQLHGRIECDDVPRVEPRVDPLDLGEAADHQPGADQEHERQRDLQHDERAAQLVAAHAAGVASPVAQRVNQVAGDRPQRRGEPEQDRGDRRSSRGVQERGEVDGRPVDARQVAGTQRRDEPDALPRQEHAEHGARPGEHGALDQHLRDDAAAAAADRRPHRDLASTLGRPDQQQVRDVGARDQQHEPDGAKEGEQGGPRVVHDVTVQSVHSDLQVLRLVERVDLAEPRGNRVHLLLRLFQRDAVTQPRDHRQPGRVPREVGDVARQHAPGIDVGRHRRVRRQVDPERRRQDAHHDRTPAIHLDRAADHVPIAAEPPLPQPVAQHHLARWQVGIGVREHLGIDRDRVVASEGPTDERPDAEQLEQVPRRVAVDDALGLAVAGQRAGDGRRPGEALEPRGLGLVVPEIGSRDERALDIGRLQARPHERQLLGMIVRQRSKQHGVRHAEHRHVAADAERQGEDDHRREERSSDKGANRVVEVANDVAEHDCGCAFLQERGGFGTKRKLDIIVGAARPDRPPVA